MDSQDVPANTADRVMSQVEPLWAVASIVVLGTLVVLCMKCRHSTEVKEDNKSHKRRSLSNNQQGFQIVRSYTVMRSEQLQVSEANKPPRNTITPISRGANDQAPDGAYVDPIATDYYNCGRFLKPPIGEDDTHAYVNVVLPSSRGSESDADESDGYVNSAQLKGKARANSGSSENDYTDPDYVNATLPKNTSSFQVR